VGLYIVVLKNPRLVANVAAEPEATSFNGALVKKTGIYRLMRVPDARLDALRRHPAVSYVQRVNTGAPGTDIPLPPLPKLEAEDSGSGAWSAPTWFSGEYRYDTAGNIASIGALSPLYGDGKPTANSDGKADTYTYDTAGRLVSATVNHGSNNTETYTYDSFGNLTATQTNGAMAIAIDVDLNSNRLNGSQYDRAGNLTGVSGSTDAYFYDPMNQLREKRVDGHSTTYIYTADDERIGIESDVGGVRWTLRDFDGKVLREFDSPWGTLDDMSPFLWVEDYVYGEGQLLAGKREEPEGGARHFHLDHLGTPRLITNASGNKYALHDYYPFGTEQSSYRQEMQDFAHDRPEPMQFTGHEREYNTGTYVTTPIPLDYMHARYYSPQWGRFLSVDPGGYDASNPQSWNRYAYVVNSPIRMTDPTGRVAAESTLPPVPSGGQLFFTYAPGNDLVVVDGPGTQIMPGTEVQATRDAIATIARDEAGNNGWSLQGTNGPGAGSYKCSAFIGDVFQRASIPVPRNRRHDTPVSAGDWGNARLAIPGWSIVSTPQPGDIVASRHAGAGLLDVPLLGGVAIRIFGAASGHVAIVTGNRRTTGASPEGVRTKMWPWRPDDHDEFVIRRFVGY
jgi:RHS repeat-associated protein